MKNILIISTSPDGRGGVATIVSLLMASSLNKKYKVTHLVTHIGGNVFIKLAYLLRAYLMYPFLLLTGKISIVHIHGAMKSSFFRKSYFMLLGKMLKIKIIYHMHSSMVEEYFLKRSRMKHFIVCKLLNQYDVIIALSQSWAQIMKKYTSTKIEIIYNAIPIPVNVNKMCNDKKKFVVLTLGEIGDRKGTQDILKIAHRLKDKPIYFNIAGNGNVDKYKKIAEELGVSQKIQWLGWIDAKQREQAMLNSHMYLLPSYNEGLPMSILEAVSYGLPIVSTPVGGISECVQTDANGYLIPPGNIAGFSGKIMYLFENEEKRKYMSRMSRKLAKSKFDIHSMANQVDNLYKNLLSCKL